MRKGLERAVRRLAGRKRAASKLPLELPFEALVNLRMEHLEERMAEVRARVNGLLLVIVGAVAADLVLRVAG